MANQEPIDTLKWLLSLVNNNVWRDIYLRMVDYSEIDVLKVAGWIELVDVRSIDTWPGQECTYRLKSGGRMKAVDAGIITMDQYRSQRNGGD